MLKNEKLYSNLKTIVLCILLNVLGYYIAKVLTLPIWLNMVGTALAVIFMGLQGGVITVIGTIGIAAFFDLSALTYAPTALLFALLCQYTVRKKRFEEFYKAVISGFWMGTLCTLISTASSMIFMKGYSGNQAGDTLVDMLLWKRWPLFVACCCGQAVVEIVDKQIVTAVAYEIASILTKRKNKKKDIKQVVNAVCVMAMVITLLSTNATTVLAAGNDIPEEQFTEKVYNNTNGLLSSSVNVIGETLEGAIWFGGYSGITVYDGSDFSFLSDSGIANAICMYTDQSGRVWIGTNDSGIAIYDHGRVSYITKKDGLPAKSVRSLQADSKGNMYVGTTSQLCRIAPDGNITLIGNEQTYIKKIEIVDDTVWVIDNVGKLYQVVDDVLVCFDQMDDFFSCMDGVGKKLLVGTESGKIISFQIDEKGLTYEKTIFSKNVSIEEIHKDGENRIWLAMKQGIGYLDSKSIFHDMHFANFDSNFEDIHEDYQGNIWFASSECGVLKLSNSKFTNLFTQAGIKNEMVNAVTEYDGYLYCGTDTGLIVFSEKTGRTKENLLTKEVGGNRVRSLLKDRKGRLWVCTYGDSGLICYEDDELWNEFTVEKDGCTSNRFRCILELEDGTIVAGTADGINVIKNDTLIKTFGSEDGLGNTQILSLARGRNGSFYAATDGAGVYEIQGDEIVNHFDSDNGLTTDIILRMVPVDNGLLVATGKEMVYINANNEVNLLVNFPYYNNYDILMQNGLAYVTSSAGIYEVNLHELISGEEFQYRLYGVNDGLVANLASNSWNMQGYDDSLYLCSNVGVIKFLPNNFETDIPIKAEIASVICDGEKVYADGERCITIPKGVREAELDISIHNYSLSDMKVKVYEEGQEQEAKTYEWNAVPTISVEGLRAGEHTYHIQVFDSTGQHELINESYHITKSRQPWEETLYQIYLWLVVTEIIIFGLLSIVIYYLSERRRDDLERMHDEQTHIIEEQTEAIREEQKKTENLLFQTVIALSGAVDAKDKYTSGHSIRVAEYSRMLAKKLGKSEKEQEQVYRAGLLHDVGKIGVPEEIINKTDKLSDMEYEKIKIHTITGYNILKRIAGNTGSIALGAKYHHERYDGYGYPNGLSGENIPEIARIIGVADAYDAMASNRSYRKALAQATIREQIEKGKGTQFDPHMAELWLSIMDADKNYDMREKETGQKDILVVDDEMMNIHVIRHILKNEEALYNLASANSGQEAIDYLKEHTVDAIFLDLMMPEMDGFETLKKIREITDTPVVFMTGDRNIENITRASEMGVEDYVTKPFLPDAFREILHGVLKG